VSATICNTGDVAPCPIIGGGIAVTSSCGGQGADAACVVADPGVFTISPLAHGAAGSACAGMGFAVAPDGSEFGRVTFTPYYGGHVTLRTPGASCRIDFTVSVAKTPDTDAQPGTPGLQTIPVAGATMRSNLGTTSFARGSQTGVTVPAPLADTPASPSPPPPSTPPPPPAQSPPPPPPASTTTAKPTAGALVPQTAAAGTAVMTGRTGCRVLPFRVQVRGTSIRKVVFRLDGRTVKTLTRPNRGKRYSLRITPRKLALGRHRVTTVTSFSAASRTRAKTMRLTFRRCR
jgi:hypothetical protein